MSLIEAAIRAAKERASTAPGVDTEAASALATAPAQVESSRNLQFEPAQEFRDFPQVETDAATMERHGVLPSLQDKHAVRAYKVLRTKVGQRLKANGWRSMIVAAASAEEGKSLTAINLAIALAQDANTGVFLVDLDLHRPKLGAYLGLRLDKGLSDYLAGNAEVDEITYSIGVRRLGIIPNLQCVPNESEVLGSQRLQDLVQRLAGELPHRIIIYDMPPLLDGDNVIKFAPNVDCTLLVVGEGKASRAALGRSINVLDQERIAGVVLNRSAERQTGGYY